jgi:hypothetical protein
LKNNRIIIKKVNGILLGGLILLFSQNIYSNPLSGLFNGTRNLGLRYDYFSESELKQILGTFSIRKNFSFATDESPFNEFRFLTSEAGLQFGSGSSSEFRGKTKLIDLNIFHQSLLLNGTIMDINKAGFLEEDIVWFGGKVGFAMVTGDDKTYLAIKILGIAGQGRWILGPSNYNKLGSFSDNRLSGLEAGYSGGFSLQLDERFFLESSFYNRKLVVDPEPNLITIQGKISMKLSSNQTKIPEIFIVYLHQTAKIIKRDLEQKNSQICAGVSIDLN